MTFHLSPIALEAIAQEIINGQAGYRTGPRIENVFKDAGLERPYKVVDCGSREKFALRALEETNQEGRLGDILIFLADPRTYPGQPETAEQVRAKLNRIIEYHSFHLTQTVPPSIEPFAQAVPPPPITTIRPQREFDFSKLTSDPVLQLQLEDRWKEAIRIHQAECPRFALIAVGALLEGGLLAKAKGNIGAANTAKAAPKVQGTNSTKLFAEWTFQDFINVAVELGWIHSTRGTFSHQLRDYRNFIHPEKEATMGISFDNGTVEIVWTILREAFEDLILASP